MDSTALKAKAVFLETFAYLLNANLPIVRALKELQESTEDAVTRQFISDLHADLENGTSITGAASSKAYFTPLELLMLKAAEDRESLDRYPLLIVKWIDRELRYRRTGSATLQRHEKGKER